MKLRQIVLTITCMAVLLMSGCSTAPNNSNDTDTNSTTTPQQEKAPFNVGETWTVDGQWTLTINSAVATEERNEFSDKNPAAVYIVNYTYTNTGYEDEDGIMDGLYISIEDSIVDSAGTMGYSYPGDITNHPKETPVGATCNAQACIGVDNAGNFTLNVTQYDGDGKKQSAKFNIEIQ